MDWIKSFWNDSSWLANALTITLGLFSFIGIIYSAYKKIVSLIENKNDYNSLTNYVKNKASINESDIHKNIKIAIIDDQPENYPVSYLQKRGFNLTVYEEVSLSDYSFIKQYGLIFLDITNVVKEDPQRGGFELIKRVNSEMENVVIIGVSSKRFDPTLTEFFKIADEQIRTPITESDCEDLINRLLKQHYSPYFSATNIDRSLGEIELSHSQHKKILRLIFTYLNNSISNDEFIKRSSNVSSKFDSHNILKQIIELKEVLS